ncbi:hypothetical protein [Deinococcus sp. UYEF24]
MTWPHLKPDPASAENVDSMILKGEIFREVHAINSPSLARNAGLGIELLT